MAPAKQGRGVVHWWKETILMDKFLPDPGDGIALNPFWLIILFVLALIFGAF